MGSAPLIETVWHVWVATNFKLYFFLMSRTVLTFTAQKSKGGKANYNCA